MSSSFEKSVKGATKIKLAPPKAKYVEHILLATSSGEAGVAEVFRTLQNRLRDSTWTIVFKALIILHLMIKDGAKDVTLAYLAANPRNRLALNSFTDVQTQGQNIRRYSEYLLARTLAFADTKVDYCKTGALERMKTLSIDKGLLRETGAIQDQIRALLKCDFFSRESENDIALMGFRLITQDLLDLYAAMNQAVMNVLSCYFELSRVDAERAITMYKTFTKQTDQVVRYLSIARSYENVTRLEIPKIKHAPTSLTKSLEEYLNDKEFDTNRRQYLATQQGRKGTKFDGKSLFHDDKDNSNASSKPVPLSNTSKATEPSSSSQSTAPVQAKGPAPDLIDFFDSIEQQQQPMAQPPPEQPQQQPYMTGMPTGQTNYPQMGNGFDAQQTGTNPFGQYMSQPPQPMNPQFTGIGFGGYGPQPPQQFVQADGQYQDMSQQPGLTQMDPQQTAQPMNQVSQIIPQSTNPFRASMIYPQNTLSPSPPQSTNPYQQRMSMIGTLNGIPEQQMAPPQMQPQQTGAFGQQDLQQFQSPAPMQLQRTGTNPFARQPQQPQQTGQTQVSSTPAALTPMVTGSTNPFRQSTFVNQQTGRGWQTGQQNTMGGLEQMETIPVFPRPGQ